jgi:negative regulator of replication initiation
MNTIEIDNEVYAALVKRVTGFNQRPNDVLRSLLELNGNQSTSNLPVPAPTLIPLLQFIGTQDYRLRKTAIEKYLIILGWLYKNHADSFFANIEKFVRGKRIYFASDPKLIAESGQGLSIKQIPGAACYALATLDNQSKRTIIAHVLALFGYPHDVCTIVAETIEDSGIRRSNSNRLLDDWK